MGDWLPECCHFVRKKAKDCCKNELFQLILRNKDYKTVVVHCISQQRVPTSCSSLVWDTWLKIFQLIPLTMSFLRRIFPMELNSLPHHKSNILKPLRKNDDFGYK